MRERSRLIAKLKADNESRAAYIRAKLDVLIPAQIRALRLRRPWTQGEFAKNAGMKQSRVSAMERPGVVNFNMETLVRSAAALGVGLEVKFVPFSEMLRWENSFSQDDFNVLPLERDESFLSSTEYRSDRGDVFIQAWTTLPMFYRCTERMALEVSGLTCPAMPVINVASGIANQTYEGEATNG